MEDNKNEKIKAAIVNDEKETPKSKNPDNIDDIIPDEVLETLPIEDRKNVVRIIKESMVSSITRRGNPISEKITEEHITKLIDKSDSQDLRDRQERKSQRSYNLIILVIGLLFLGFLIIFLKDDKELLYKIIVRRRS